MLGILCFLPDFPQSSSSWQLPYDGWWHFLFTDMAGNILFLSTVTAQWKLGQIGQQVLSILIFQLSFSYLYWNLINIFFDICLIDYHLIKLCSKIGRKIFLSYQQFNVFFFTFFLYTFSFRYDQSTDSLYFPFFNFFIFLTSMISPNSLYYKNKCSSIKRVWKILFWFIKSISNI